MSSFSTLRLNTSRGFQSAASLQMALFTAVVLGYFYFNRSVLIAEIRNSPLVIVNIWDVGLRQIGDPRLITFVVLTAWLIYVLTRVAIDYEPLRLLRHGGYKATLIAGLTRSAALLTVGILIVVIAAAVLSIGFPFGSDWSAAARSFSPLALDSRPFVEAGIPPVVGLVIQIFQTAVALLAIHVALTVLHILSGRMWVTATAATVMWLWATLASSGLARPGSLLNFGYYLDAKSVIGTAILPFVYLILGGIIIGGLVAVQAKDRARNSGSIPWSSPWFWYVGLSLVLVSLSTLGAAQPASFEGLLSAVFAGRGGTITDYLVYSFVFIGYAYCFLVRRTQIASGGPTLQLIRHGSYVRWATRLFRREVIVIPLVLSFSVVVVVAVAWVTAGRIPEMTVGAPVAAYNLVVNGSLQILLYLIVIFIAASVTGTELAGIAAAAILVVAGSPLVPTTRWLPFSFAPGIPARTFPDTLSVSVVLLLWVLILAGALTLVLTKRLNKISEGTA